MATDAIIQLQANSSIIFRKLTRRACVDIVPAIVMASRNVEAGYSQNGLHTHYVMWNFPVSAESLYVSR
jgi:hypothetical protein